MNTNTKSLLVGLTFCLVIGVGAGCGKKQTTAAPTPEPEPPAAPAANGPTPPPAAAPAPATVDEVVLTRTLDYTRGLIARKEYDEARKVFKSLEGKTLTPAQQKVLDELKAQIPNG